MVNFTVPYKDIRKKNGGGAGAEKEVAFGIGRFMGSGSGRTARAKRNILGMVLLRGVSVVCGLIVVPLTIDYVSQYEYGIWLTISSLVTWLGFFDLGISNGLRNKFIEAVELGKHRLAKIYVSTAYALISLLVGGVWVGALGASFAVDWCKVLNADVSLSRELMWTVAIVVSNFSLVFILGINRTLLNAIQKPALASGYDTATQVLLCITLWLLVRFTDGSLIYLALAMGGTSVLVLAAGNVWTFSGMLRRYRPSLRNVRFRMARGVMGMGLMFFFIQIIAIAFYQTNNLIISHYVGPDEVTVYNVAYKYMSVLTMAFAILIAPFWSAYAEANVNGDTEWMRRTTRKLIRLTLLLALGGLAMVALSPWFYRIWLQGSVEVPLLITLLVGLFHIFNMWSTLWTQLLSGFGKIRLQVLMSTLCCVSYLPMGLWGCAHYGLTGLLVASLISFAAFTSWFGVIQVRKLINGTAKGIWNK